MFKENKKIISLDTDAMIFILQKPLFYFFKSCFIKFSEGSSNSESNLGDIANIWYTFISPWKQIRAPSDQYEEAFKDYIFLNLLFYTELLNDYIVGYSLLNFLNKNEISLLYEVLNMYKINDEDEIIFGRVNLKILEDLATGKIYVIFFLIYRIMLRSCLLIIMLNI